MSLMDHKEDVYYAQIRGLLIDAYCEKSAVITWLIPTLSSPPPNERFDASTYLIGRNYLNIPLTIALTGILIILQDLMKIFQGSCPAWSSLCMRQVIITTTKQCHIHLLMVKIILNQGAGIFGQI